MRKERLRTMYLVTIRNTKTNEIIKAQVTGLANVLQLTNQFKTKQDYSLVIQKRK